MISTPSKFLLNFRGLETLNAELATWENKARTLYGEDLAAAQDYINAVRAERDQRAQQYAGGTLSVIAGGFTAPFESLGSSGGEGATGLAGEVLTGAENIASDTVTGFKRYTTLILVAAFLLIGWAIWVKFKKG